MLAPTMLMAAVRTAAHSFLDFSFSIMILKGLAEVCDDRLGDDPATCAGIGPVILGPH